MSEKLRFGVRMVHLWLGLGLGGLFVILGLSGSALAFYPEIDALLHPEIQQVSTSPPNWDRALATLRAAYPEKKGPWRFEVTGQPGAIPARYYDPPTQAGHAFRPLMVWLSPDGGRVLRRAYWGDYAMTFLYDLHYRLLLGDLGGKMLGWAGLALLALLLSGLWAWWPRGTWTKALRLKRHGAPLRRLRDWHKITGLSGLAFLLLLTATGIMLELPEQSDTALNALGMMVDPRPDVRPEKRARLNAPAVSPSAAMRAAKAALPFARIAWIETPAAIGGPYRVRLQVAGDPSHRFPHSFVWVDGATGRVLAVQDVRKGRAGTRINAWLHPLHNGAAAGLIGRSLVALLGLLPLALFATGWLRWRALRASRRVTKMSQKTS